MRFDWYQATVPEQPIKLVNALKSELSGYEVREGKGRHNYHQSFTILDGEGQRLASILCGGPNGHPNVTGSGENTPHFVDVLRTNWPRHNVTRFDASEDFTGEQTYDRLEEICRRIATEKKVKGRSIVPDDLADGRTYYLGAPSSDVRVRLYDKAAELRRHLAPDQHHTIPDHLTRLEAQVRPKKDFKAFSAKVDVESVWGYSGWTWELYSEVFKLPLERIEMKAGRESDDARAYRFMLQQYRRILERQCADLGTWAAVGLQIGDDLRKLASKDEGRSEPAPASEG